MSNDNGSTSEEIYLKEKLRKMLKKNRTPIYTSDDEGGTYNGPIDKKSMEEQTEEDDEKPEK